MSLVCVDTSYIFVVREGEWLSNFWFAYVDSIIEFLFWCPFHGYKYMFLLLIVFSRWFAIWWFGEPEYWLQLSFRMFMKIGVIDTVWLLLSVRSLRSNLMKASCLCLVVQFQYSMTCILVQCRQTDIHLHWRNLLVQGKMPLRFSRLFTKVALDLGKQRGL